MVRQSKNRIIISGAGIAGLTQAIALGRSGFDVAIHEASDRLEPIGAGLQLSPNAWSVCRELGLEAALEAACSFPQSICIADGKSGRTLGVLPLGSEFRKRFGSPYAVVHRGDLQEILLHQLAGLSNVTLTLASPIDNYAVTGGGIEVTMNSVSVDSGRVLVAADGVKSRLRETITHQQLQTYSGKTAWRALVPAERIENPAFLKNTHVWLSRHCHLVSYPIRKESFLNLVLILPGGPADAQHASVADLPYHSRIEADDAVGLLGLAESWAGWPIYSLGQKAIMKGPNLAFVGDAAHAMLPFAAQGAAMAIEDAMVLQQCISEATDTQLALNRYAQTRKSRNEAVMRFARANGRIYHLPFPLSLARNIAMRLMSGKTMMRRQAWIYGWQPQS